MSASKLILMKTIIVDDEPKAIELVRSYAEQFNFLEIVGTFRNGLKALAFIEANPVDFIILDINMPHISGISVAKLLNGTGVKIIFTTAYSQFATESYEVEAIDYLLKPLSFERFTKAINKLVKQREAGSWPAAHLTLKSSGKMFRILRDEICYLQKLGNYIEYVQIDGKLLVRESVATAMMRLPDYFIRIHKSYIINLKRVKSFNKEEVIIAGKSLPIGPTYKDSVVSALTMDSLFCSRT